MFTIEYSKDADKTLRSLPRNLYLLIQEKLTLLAVDPFAKNNNIKKLEGEPEYRLRVGSWRVIYDLQEGRLIILVIRIAPRGGAYK